MKWHPALSAGPYISVKLKATKITEIEGMRNKTIMPNVKNTDLGIACAFSTDFDFLSGQMVIDLRTSYSLVNMMDRIDGFIPSYYGAKKEYARNVCISLSIGYRFLNLLPGKAKTP